jgi:predicted MFS family arabinose efflux permease
MIPFLATVFVMMALQMSSLGFSPLLPGIQKEFGMTFSKVGFFTGMYGLSALLLSLPGGMLAKRFGEKRVLSLGLVVVMSGLIVLSRASSSAMAFAGRALWLVGYRPAFVCVMTAIALTTPKSLRSRSMGIIGAISAFAAVIGAPFGSIIGRDYGWRTGILAFAGMALVGVVVFYSFYGKKTGVPAAGGKSESAEPGAGPKKPKAQSAFRNPVVWAVAALEGMVGVGYFSSNFFVPSAVDMVFHLKALDAAYIISTGFIVGIFANVLFGYLMDRFNKWNVMGTMMIILIPASLCMTTANLLLFRVAAAIVLAVGLSAAQQGYTLAAELATGRETGNVMGAVALGTGIFGYFGPQMLGFLRDWTGGFTAGWYLVTIIAALALIEIIGLKYYLKAKGSAITGAVA